MHFKLLYPTDYVGAHDLNGKDAVLVIEKIDREELMMEGGKKEKKPVVWFKGAKKRMVMNKTNAKTIARLYGPEMNDWIGKAIILYPTTCKVGPNTEECIRIQPRIPQPSTPKPAANQAAPVSADDAEAVRLMKIVRDRTPTLADQISKDCGPDTAKVIAQCRAALDADGIDYAA